jgi:hypothetical protein
MNGSLIYMVENEGFEVKSGVLRHFKVVLVRSFMFWAGSFQRNHPAFQAPLLRKAGNWLSLIDWV